MKIRSVILCLLSTFSAFMANAQGFQVRGGINLANVSVTNSGRVNQANQLTNFQAGFIGDIPLVPHLLSLQTGLLFTGKGSEVQNGTSGQAGYFKQTFNPMYLEIPANLVIKAPLGMGNKFFFGAGPYVAMGVAGKVKTQGTSLAGSYSYDNNITFSNDDPTTFNQEEGTGLGVIRRFDYGLNGTAGIETKSLVIGVNYGLGLAKLQSGTNSGADDNNKNRVLSITLGFKL